MRKVFRNWKSGLGAAVLTLGLIVVPGSPAAAYSPGYATATKPKYNAAKGGWDYKCSFTGWRSGARVTWYCYLHSRSSGGDYIVKTNTGGWTPGSSSYTTPTIFRAASTGEPQYCVEAYAYSVDGGRSSAYACN